MIGIGRIVRFARLPEWVARMPEESARVFRFCLGRTYRVQEIDHHGLFVLDISADADSRFGGFMNDIRLETEYLDEILNRPPDPLLE